jgi:hypothetical protein
MLLGACHTHPGMSMGWLLVLVVQQFPVRFHWDEPLGWLAMIHLGWQQLGVCWGADLVVGLSSHVWCLITITISFASFSWSKSAIILVIAALLELGIT